MERDDDDESSLEPSFPLEFIVYGTPLSNQSRSGAARTAWKDSVREASRAVLPEGHWQTERRLATTLYYFPDSDMQGDIDNIVKLVLDALTSHIYFDDRQIERVVVQKFEPGRIFAFSKASGTLASAIAGPKPALYCRLSDRPSEELR